MGFLISVYLNGVLAEWSTPDGGTLDYQKFWLAAAALAGAAFVLLILLFRDETHDDATDDF